MASSNYSACEFLKKAAEQVYLPVLFCGMRQHCPLAGEVATKLGLIAGEPLAKYEIDHEDETLAVALLLMLSRMCIFPLPVGGQSSPRQFYEHIALSASPDQKASLEKSLSSFFVSGGVLPAELRTKCDLFLSTISEDESTPKSGLERLTAGSRLPEPNCYPPNVAKELFTALRRQAFCQESKETRHTSFNVDGSPLSLPHHNLPHPMRLHLDTVPLIHDSNAHFEVVISSDDMAYWQHLRLGIPVRARRGRFETAQASSNEREDGVGCDHKGVDADYFCQILKRQLFNKVKLNFVKGTGLVMLPPPAPLERFLCAGKGLRLSSVIPHYDLTEKDKFVLAHSIAKYFWRFYATDFMRHLWTSHDVWFMRERDHEDNPKAQIALQAFVPVQFEADSMIPEELRDEMSTHPFPHILGLGILLLEIGLSQTYTSNLDQPLVSRFNRDHGYAISLLSKLEKAHWSRPAQRDIFVRAIEGCLDPSRFTATRLPFNSSMASRAIEDRKDRDNQGNRVTYLKNASSELATAVSIFNKHSKPTPTISEANDDGSNIRADERRERLYREVVEPLEKLVKVAFKADEGCVKYLERCKEDTPIHGTSISQLASFHIGKTVVPHEWLENLKHISRHISLLRRQKKHVYSHVKIAILDTGYDPQLMFFKSSHRAKSIKAWRDFVSPETNEDIENTTGKDSFGHGSLMTRLAMETAPLAHVYVGRVAEDTTDLDTRSEEVAKAIRWAGLEEKVDIVSMSFGFPLDSELISRAIQDVERERSVIFLASAGNNAGYHGETFPARHKSVISIRATDCQGTFSASNPLIDASGTLSLGTFGDDLPDNVKKEISDRFGSKVCEPGSSIATAVAAGIAASTIAYAEVLSDVLPVPAEENPVTYLKTGEGMMRALEEMAPGKTGHQRFVNPMWFWYENRDPWSAWVAISHAVSPLRNKSAEK